MRIPLVISLLLHVAIITVAVLRFSAPEELKAPPQEALPVEIVDIEDVSRRTAMRRKVPEPPKEPAAKPAPPRPEPVKQTPKPAPKPAREVRRAAPAPRPAPQPEPQPAPAPKAEQTLDELVKKVAEQQPAPEPKTPPKPKVQPKPGKPLPKVRPRPRPRIARRKPGPRPKKAAARNTPQEHRRDPIDEIAALLNKTDEPHSAPPPPSQRQGTPLQGSASIDGDDARIAADLADALRARIEECWNIPAGVRDAERLKVRLRFQLAPGGVVSGGPQVLNSMNHPAFAAAAQSAVRAVLACQPYAFLPADRYDLWKDVILTFDPGRMLAVN